jgi:hypothetical protein
MKRYDCKNYARCGQEFQESFARGENMLRQFGTLRAQQMRQTP